MAIDKELREEAFRWLDRMVAIHGDVLPFTLLRDGFEYKNHKISFVNVPGIWRPRGFDVPLSIRTGTDSPYSDKTLDGGTLIYSYRGTDPNHLDNRGLRRAMEYSIPIVYFKTISRGNYLVQYPVYIDSDDPGALSFTVDLSPAIFKHYPDLIDSMNDPKKEESGDFLIQKRYAIATYERRVHQAKFRDQVLNAYRCECTMCSLKHKKLLDAAHIIPDREEYGAADVTNGLSLCKIHHAAFDNNIIGISPDYVVEVREDVLEEIDGPMLKYGLQSMHGQKIHLPRSRNLRPDRERLAFRYEEFRGAG